jgi:serine phosphatase RsbU (regulator of sigma subunit)
MPGIAANNPPDLSALDAEVVDRFEQGRGRMLRRRLVWYCCVVLALLAISIVAGSLELAGPPTVAGEEYRRAGPVLELVGDMALLTLYIAALGYALGGRPGRNRLVQVITWLTILASCVVILVAPMVQLLSYYEQGIAGEEPGVALGSGLMGLLSIMVLHALACLLIQLTPRESLRIFVPIAVVFAAAVFFVYVGNVGEKAVLLGLLPLAGAPGFVWTWWRFVRYRDVSRAAILHGRYSELASELASARQMHEALFPPPIERGPYRMLYRYEPKREIGGDFLFAHPLAFPPSEVDSALTVVVLDVTGHGVAAALAVNRLHGELRRVFAQSSFARAGEVIEALNAYASEHLAPQAIFATAVCLRLDGGVLEYASAGHPAALLRRNASAPRGRVEQLGATATMLGVLDSGLFAAGAKEVSFGTDDVVVALTDGAIEALDRRARELGLAGVQRVLEESELSNASAAARIMGAVVGHRAGAAVDDTLVVEVRRGQ